MSKVAVIGAGGMIGQRIVKELLSRGHRVTALVRDSSRVGEAKANLEYKIADIFDAESVARGAAGCEALVSAYGPGSGEAKQLLVATQSLIEALGRLPGTRLIMVGGAGSLEVAPGVAVVDTPDFPAMWKAIALAHRDALGMLRRANIDWTYASPPGLIEPGERTGKFRIGTEQLLLNERGESKISAEDYAVAIADEVEQPKFVRKRFTAGY